MFCRSIAFQAFQFHHYTRYYLQWKNSNNFTHTSNIYSLCSCCLLWQICMIATKRYWQPVILYPALPLALLMVLGQHFNIKSFVSCSPPANVSRLSPWLVIKYQIRKKRKRWLIQGIMDPLKELHDLVGRDRWRWWFWTQLMCIWRNNGKW